jgi:hypothetical protein
VNDYSIEGAGGNVVVGVGEEAVADAEEEADAAVAVEEVNFIILIKYQVF